jgi:hypothetical protein
MTALLRDSVAMRAGPSAWRADAEVRVDEIVLPGGRTALAASAVIRTDRDDVAAPVTAVFAISDPASRRVLLWYHPAADPAADFPLTRTLLDVADLDGDGVPEIVTRTDLSEEWRYTIYRRAPNGWAETVNAYGGGC